MFKKTLLGLFVLTLMLTACSPSAPAAEAMEEKPTDVMMEKTSESMMENPAEVMMEKTSEAMMEKTPDAMMEKSPQAMMEKTPDSIMEKTPEAMKSEMMDAPAWFSATLNNVHTGEDFTLNDFKGKVVLVETLAMWCPNCKRQQMEVKALHEALGMEKDLVSIGLDIDPNENAADLKAYTDSNGFDWIYAIAPKEVAHEIGSLYGDQFLNPSSTPIVIIDRHGQTHPLPFGIKSAEELMEYVDPFLKEGI